MIVSRTKKLMYGLAFTCLSQSAKIIDNMDDTDEKII